MSAREISEFGTIEEYFFKENFLVQVGGAGIVLACNLLWVIVALTGGDPYNRLSSHSGYFMYAVIILSAVVIVLQSWAMSLMKKNKCGTTCQKKKKCQAMRFLVLVYNILVISSVASISITNNQLIAATTKTSPGMSIALSAVLLLIPAFSPSSHRIDGCILLVVGMTAVALPRFVAGSEYYSFFPELLLRLGLAFAYTLLDLRTRDRYEKQVKINETAQELRTKNHRMIEISEEMVELLANAVEQRDAESGEHVKRVKAYTRILSMCVMNKYEEYGLTLDDIDRIVRASALHDVGKIRIPDNILLKPGKLTDEEFELMKKHTVFGYELLMSNPKTWDSDFLNYCTDIALYHHEKYDGRGYPDGLKGDEIPVAAQIVSVADCYDALISVRRYKRAYTPQEAYDMIQGGECGAFSDKIMSCFAECKSDFEAIAAG